MMRNAIRWVAGEGLRLVRQPRRNRFALDGGQYGIRMLAFHAEDADMFPRFQRLVEWCAERFEWATPGDVDALLDGRAVAGAEDRILVTFDDGHERTYQALAWLAQLGIRAISFVIPSYIDRTVRQYLRYHAERGVKAYDIASGRDHDRTRGLSCAQLHELEAMGHRIAAHNFAHRDLGTAADGAWITYEVDAGLEQLEELLEHHCDDFAWAFGSAQNLTGHAAAHLRRRCTRVYSAVRGRNVPGHSPRFLLRDNINIAWPLAFSTLCVEGGADHRYRTARESLIAWSGRLPGETENAI